MKFAVGIIANAPIQLSMDWARWAEEYGFESLGYTEDMMYKSGWPQLFLASQHTSRIKLGITLSNPYTTHPAILANYAALLDEVSGGRAYLCLGRGHLQVLKSMLNVVPPKPLAGLEEAVRFCKRLWQRDATTFRGEVFHGSEEAVLQWVPQRPDIPIWVGAWGPRAIQMAGRRADGVVAYGVWRSAYIEELQRRIELGASEGDRADAQVPLIVEPLFSISEDCNEAKGKARRDLAATLEMLTPITEFIDPELLERIDCEVAAGNVDGAAALISDDLLDQFAVCGDPRRVIEMIEAKQSEVGLTHMSFTMPFEPDDVTAHMHLVGRHVLPHFEGRA